MGRVCCSLSWVLSQHSASSPSRSLNFGQEHAGCSRGGKLVRITSCRSADARKTRLKHFTRLHVVFQMLGC